MRAKKLVKVAAKKLLGIDIHAVRSRGVDEVRDIAKMLSCTKITTVFDVGANEGQSAKSYLAAWPAAEIFSFEPVPSTYARLSALLRGTKARPFQLGLSSAPGQARMTTEGQSDMLSLTQSEDSTTQAITLSTVDEFCREKGIERISFMKIDTEGHDLEVLKGASTMLASGRIDIVQVEAGMNPKNTLHVPFEQLKSFLEGHGYLLFGFYDQKGEWIAKQPQLRRTNPMFISPQVIAANSVTA